MNQITYKIISDAREYVQGLKPAVRAGQELEHQNSDLEKVGVKTTAQFRREVAELDRLTHEYKQDELAVAQLTQRKRALVGEMKRVEAQVVGGKKAVGGLTTGMGALRAGVAAFAASGAIQIFTEFARAGIEGQQAYAQMYGSIAVARREFGDAIGTQERWAEVTKDLGDQFQFLSDKAIARAASATVGMTKRLGLNADQMQVVMQRTAALSIGKTDLEDATTRITAALRGEAEASELLGLTLNQDYINQRALALGINKELLPALTDVQKAQIRYIELLAQSEETYANVNTLLVNQAARVANLGARWDDFKTSMGNALLVAIDAGGVFDVAEGKITFFEFAQRAALVATGNLQAAQVLATTQNAKATEGVDELTEAYDNFKTTINSLSPEVASGLDEATFRAAAAAGDLAAFRRDIFSRASDEIVKKINEEARALRGAGTAAKSITETEAEAVGKLKAQLALLNTEEGYRIGELLAQKEVLQDQVKERAAFLKLGAEAKDQRAFRLDAGTTADPSRVAPRGQDRLPIPGLTRVQAFTKPDEQGGGIGFITELIRPLDELAEKAPRVSKETQAAIEEITRTAQDEADGLADALSDPFDRAGIAFDYWLLHTKEGLGFLAESVAEAAFNISDGFSGLFDVLVERETEALVKSGLSREEANKKAIESQKVLFNISKGLSIAGAIADTYAAANKALKAAPPPVNYVLMAGVIAAGIANVAKIAAASPGGGSGGGGSSSFSTAGTTSFVANTPASIDQTNATFAGFSAQAAQQNTVTSKLDEVVTAINDIDATTTLKDDHVFIQVSRAGGKEKAVGV